MRHGETEWSAEGRHSSRTDLSLTGHGRRQAERLREHLRGVRFDAVFVSPMRRARETCAIAAPEARAIVEAGLKEWDYGIFEGKTTAEIRAAQPGWSVWKDEVDGGETAEQVGERADGVIARAMEAAPNEGRVALFAHAHLLRILMARWLRLDPRMGAYFALETGTVSILGWERETPVIERWNCPCL